MGALIMAHSDNNGLVLPPQLAPIHVVMVPIFKTDEEHQAILDKMYALKKELEAKGLSVKVDDRDNLRPGFKFAEWELKGVPTRIAIGPRDLANGMVELARRDTLTKESVPQDGLAERISDLMTEIQNNIYQKALNFRDEHTIKVDTWEEFKEKIEQGYFLLCHWDGTSETEQKIQELTKATIRCIPMDTCVCEEEGKCILTGKPSSRRVVFAKAY
jgi:prolyl-tRNA synthetase